MKQRKPRVVRKVTEKTMDGSTPLHRWINAYLTKRFILSKNVPSDECIMEAHEIVTQVIWRGLGLK
jgi:hypothetical protein